MSSAAHLDSQTPTKAPPATLFNPQSGRSANASPEAKNPANAPSMSLFPPQSKTPTPSSSVSPSSGLFGKPSQPSDRSMKGLFPAAKTSPSGQEQSAVDTSNG
jgi:hypothetical protein